MGGPKGQDNVSMGSMVESQSFPPFFIPSAPWTDTLVKYNNNELLSISVPPRGGTDSICL